MTEGCGASLSDYQSAPLFTDWPRILSEGVVIREPSIDGNGWSSVEPREERQFLQSVSKAVRCSDGDRSRATQWVADFQIDGAAHISDWKRGHLTAGFVP